MDIEFRSSPEHRLRVKKQKKKKMISDSVLSKRKTEQAHSVSELNTIIKHNHKYNTQTLLLKGSRTDFFVTQDSHRYITQEQAEKISQNYDYIDPRGYFDSVHHRYVKKYTASELQQKYLIAEFRSAKNVAINFREALRLDLSPIRMWQVSLAGAVLFGMVSMSMIYKNLGQNAFAKGVEEAIGGSNDKIATAMVDEKVTNIDNKEQNTDGSEAKEKIKETKKQSEQEKVKELEKQKKDVAELKNEIVEDKDTKTELAKNVDGITVEGASKKEDIKNNKKEEVNKEKVSVDSVVKKKEAESDEKGDNEENQEYSLEEAAYELVEGYPIEKMLPYILEQDPEVAKYLIAMAKQESAWGKRVPVLNGQDCYNYWGYRGKRKLMGSGGHTCFNSRKDAVETVGKRLHELIYDYDRKTPERLIVWKCGSSCDGHSQEGVNRWINVVKSNYNKLSDVKTVSKK